MAAPPAYLSSLTGFTLIDTRNASGTVTLPAASNLYGRIITFKDQYGSFKNYPLTLKTSAPDVFESGSSNLVLSNTYEYRTLIAGADNRWYTIANPFTVPTTLSTATLQASTLVLLDRANTSNHSVFFSSGVLYDTTAPVITPMYARYQVFTL
jgi:2',3'-cyclic-nucleotide 2'-phosphodiesterase (5'-nucleotidase family)